LAALLGVSLAVLLVAQLAVPLAWHSQSPPGLEYKLTLSLNITISSFDTTSSFLFLCYQLCYHF
jgi:hypothetical protein